MNRSTGNVCSSRERIGEGCPKVPEEDPQHIRDGCEGEKNRAEVHYAMQDHAMVENTRSALRLLARDVALTSLPFHADVYDLTRKCWMGGTEKVPPLGFDEGFVLALPGRQTAIHPTIYEGPDFAEIMEAACDWVMDELGRGWPELADDSGRFIGLLNPAQADQQMFWVAGSARAPLGSLERYPLVQHS